jgi:hypothetical protein
MSLVSRYIVVDVASSCVSAPWTKEAFCFGEELYSWIGREAGIAMAGVLWEDAGGGQGA